MGKAKKERSYQIILIPDKEGGYTVEVPKTRIYDLAMPTSEFWFPAAGLNHNTTAMWGLVRPWEPSNAEPRWPVGA